MVNRLCVALLGLALAVSALAPQAGAAPAPAAEPTALPDGPDDPTVRPRGEVALSHFYAGSPTLRLRDDASQQDFFISMARTAVVKDAILDLHYINSALLKQGRSILSVRLNETTLAQIRLDPTQPMGQAKLRLPAELWRAGYNKLSVAVTQHYTDTCEDPESPELWTELDLARSRITFDMAPLDRPYLLSDLGSLFSPGLGGQRQVTLLTAPGGGADRLRREALPYVAQALALRRQFAPLQISHTPWLDARGAYLPQAGAQGAVHVVVGTSEQLAAILPPQDLPVVDGPKALLTGTGRGRARLVVTGRTDDEVIAAARNMAVMIDALTQDAQVTFPADGRTAPPLPLAGRASMEGGKTYRFEALGFQTIDLQGAGLRQVQVQLPLPADFYTHENAKGQLSLDFAYGAGMGPGSVVNITLNGKRVHGLLMDNKDGESFHKYLIQIPVRLMVPGANVLTLDISTRPQIAGGDCTGVKSRHLLFQLFSSSTITIPEAGHAAVLPDLARFAMSGFPYVAANGRATGTVYVASPELMGGALTLIGKMAQTARGSVDGWRVETGLPKGLSGQAIVLATTAQLESDSFGDWSLSLSRIKKWPYRALQDLRTVSDQPQLTLGSLSSALFGEKADPGIAAAGETVSQRSSLGQRAVLAASRNPNGKADETLTVIAADSAATLTARMNDLVDPRVWGQMRGDLVAWQDREDPMFTIQVADHYEVAQDDWLLMLRLTFSTNPWYWVGATAATAALAALLSWVLLRRRHAKFARRDQ
ncbi:MAG TPA: cellulose biosynthesis cyclic di-GMP-binding regulatory protein BcsB [Magnetospirillum sp.]|nr:cellulose biosynthesis cyclic di-GMP-binding regulatory protein BcsB [Magnetospirillum sp.]